MVFAAHDAAALLVAAHRSGRPINRLPEACRPADVAEAYAVQDDVIRALGPIGGWKVGTSGPAALPSCAPVCRDVILPSDVVLDPARYHGLALEIEFAFRLRRDLPPRAVPYGYDEVADAVDFMPLVEVLGSRFRDRTQMTPAEQLADANANGAFVLGTPVSDWRALDFRRTTVELAIDGVTVQSACGTHPAGDPVLLLLWQANHAAARCGGLKAGDIVTTGSLQGATPIAPGGKAVGDWGKWGRVALSVAG